MSENERLLTEEIRNELAIRINNFVTGNQDKIHGIKGTFGLVDSISETIYPLAFEAGRKAQAEKDRAVINDKQYTIEKAQQFWKESERQLSDTKKALAEAKKQGMREMAALDEAEKRGARELMKWAKTFAFTDPQFVPASGKEAVRVCIPEGEWQAKLKEMEER